MKQLLFIALVLINMLLGACRKINHETDVSGTVYDASTMAVISQAHVYLLKENGNCFTCNPVPFADTYADANGNFSFNYKADKGYSYSLGATATNYFDEPGGNIYVVNFKNNKNEKILLKPHAYLKLHIKNTIPFNGDDVIGVNFTTSPFHFYGTQIDTTLTAKVFGNSTNPVSWAVTKNNLITNYSGSIYCPRFDTTTYTINY